MVTFVLNCRIKGKLLLKDKNSNKGQYTMAATKRSGYCGHYTSQGKTSEKDQFPVALKKNNVHKLLN